MATIEKEKALDVVRQMVTDGQVSQEVAEKYFPELKESEGEKIRKHLIGVVELYYGNTDEQEKKDCLAWLEKQGEKGTNGNKREIPITEQNLTGKVEPKFKVGNKIKLAKEPKYPAREIIAIQNDAYYFDERVYLPFSRQDEWELVEQKPADLKTKAGNWYICDKEVMNENMVTAFHRDEVYYCPKDGYLDVGGAIFEVGCLDVFRLATEKEIPQPKQKPAWSEEDETRLTNIIIMLKEGASLHFNKKDITKAVDWLKSLKERVQPKQEWSEEDENHVKSILSTIECCKAQFPNAQAVVEAYNADIEWLKSLRHQNTWKSGDLPHWKKSTLPNDNTTGFNSDYFCYKGYNINYKQLFEKLPKDD